MTDHVMGEQVHAFTVKAFNDLTVNGFGEKDRVSVKLFAANEEEAIKEAAKVIKRERYKVVEVIL